MRRCTAIVPAWRAERTLARTLRSLARNRDVVERVIVVTEATDAAAAVARSFAGVEVVELDARASAGRARGVGRAAARLGRMQAGADRDRPVAGGRISRICRMDDREPAASEPDLLLFVDADCALEPGAAARLIDALERDGLDAAGASIVREGGGAIGWLRHLLEFKDFEPGVPGPAAPFVPSAALLVRAAAFDRAGGFPDMWPGEDLVFCHRLAAAGGRVAKVDEARAAHLHPGGVGAFFAHQYRLGATSARARRMISSMRGGTFARHRWLAPLLFAGRAMRAVAWLARFRPRELWRFALLAPLYAAGLGAWTAGFASLAATPGSAGARTLTREAR